MRLSYCRLRGGNFGDDLNPWLWPRLAPGLLDDDPGTEFLGIGTWLHHRHPPGVRRVVFSTGAGYNRLPRLDANWDFHCVRGPLTAALLRLPRRLAVTDGAVLVRTLRPEPVEKRHIISYIPHHRSQQLGDWKTVCRTAGIHYIDPGGDVETVLAEIRRSRLLISEALHGAVVADALRIPWIAVRGHGFILRLKWEDWCRSLEMPYRPHDLPPLWQQPLPLGHRARNLPKRLAGLFHLGKEKWGWAPLRVSGRRRVEQCVSKLTWIAERAEPQLSPDRSLDRATNELLARLDRLKRAYGVRRSA